MAVISPRESQSQTSGRPKNRSKAFKIVACGSSANHTTSNPIQINFIERIQPSSNCVLVWFGQISGDAKTKNLLLMKPQPGSTKDVVENSLIFCLDDLHRFHPVGRICSRSLQ